MPGRTSELVAVQLAPMPDMRCEVRNCGKRVPEGERYALEIQSGEECIRTVIPVCPEHFQLALVQDRDGSIRSWSPGVRGDLCSVHGCSKPMVTGCKLARQWIRPEEVYGKVLTTRSLPVRAAVLVNACKEHGRAMLVVDHNGAIHAVA